MNETQEKKKNNNRPKRRFMQPQGRSNAGKMVNELLRGGSVTTTLYEEPAKHEKPVQPPAKKQRQGNRQNRDGNAARNPAPAPKKEKAQKPNYTSQNHRPKPNKPNRPNGANPEKPLRIIPLGGLGEIGKNCTVFEYDGDMFLVDCGMSFPDEETPGIDVVIPDFAYVLENKDKIKGLVVTHGHEDHIGSIPYLLRNFNLPIYATPLTVGLIEGKLKEHHLLADAHLNVIHPGETVQLGKFRVEFIHVNHSIPDAVGFAITCGAGTVIHTGDFKIDTTPIDDRVIDLARFAEYGRKGVLALLSDSTNAERPGYTPSERLVGESFSTLFKKADGHRIIVATFSSNIHRIQQIIDEAVRVGRKVAASGRSMLNVIAVAEELGYLNVPKGVLVDIETIRNYAPENLVIVTTGSQGEPLSALHRMAFSDHRQVEIVPNDMIIISANPIPGNEVLVGRVINELMKRGASVVYEKMYDVHVSGHACQDEIKLMMAITKPQYFIPVHGEQKHLYKNMLVAQAMGIDKKNTLIAENGNVIEVSRRNGLKITDTVPAGRVLVDGLGVGDVGSIVLRDRKHLAEDGIIIVTLTADAETRELLAGPDVVSRGFVYVKESEELMTELNGVVQDLWDKYASDWSERGNIKLRIKDGVSKFLFQKTHRSPIVLPIIMEV